MSIESRSENRLTGRGLQITAPVAYAYRSAHMPSSFLTEWFLPIVGRLIAISVNATAAIAPAALLLAVYGAVNGQVGLTLTGVALASLAGLGMYARFVAPFRLKVKQLNLRECSAVNRRAAGADSAQSLRVCFFSDLHAGRYKRAAWLTQVVELVNAQSPDVVLIGGDFVGHLDGHTRHTLDQLLHPLRNLRARLGVFAVFGNHDYGLPGPDVTPELEPLLAGYGIRVLRNECAPLGARHQLVAVDELWADRDNVARAFGHADPSRTTVFLGHNPDVMAKVKPDQCATIFLFGHTHAGQIYLPFLPGFGVPVKTDLYRGLRCLPQGIVYVSSGCGESETPIRLGTSPEIVVFEV
ncbi:MAG: metallophosphoesterase [Anaerolineae bacterium]